LEQAVELNPADTDAQKKLKEAKDYQAKMPQIEAKMKEFDKFIAEKKIVSSYQKLLEIQDILRSIGSSGQSSNNPIIIKYNKDYNELNKWYNELIQKTNPAWTRLFQPQYRESAEKLLTDILKYEHHEATRRNYESSLQMVRMQKGLQAQCEAKWTEGTALYSAKKYNEALVKFKENLTCNPNNQERRNYVAQIENSLKQQEAQRQQLEQAKRLIDEGYNLERQGNIAGAIQRYKQSLQIAPNPELQKRITQIENNLMQCEAKWTEGTALYNAKKYNEALVKFRENLTCNPNNQDRRNYVAQLENNLKQQEAQKQACMNIRKQGDSLVQQKRLKEAVVQYREHLKCNPDRQLEEYVRQIEDILKKEEGQRQRYEYARRLRVEGEQLLRAGRIQEAIAKYRESLRYQPDAALEKHIRELELSMVRPTPTPQPTPTPRPPEVTASINLTGNWIGRCEGQSSQYSIDIRHNGNNFTARSEYDEYSGTITGNQIRGKSKTGDDIMGAIINNNQIKITIAYKNISYNPQKCDLQRMDKNAQTQNNQIVAKYRDKTVIVVYVEEGISWDQANRMAMTMGGTLVSLNSAEKNNFIFRMIEKDSRFWWIDPSGNAQGPWTGGIKDNPSVGRPNEGWRWLNGEIFNYTNWHSGEPNNSGGVEDRIVLFKKTDKWNDIGKGAKLKGFIMEK
ncbi:MAG: hypothetical protein N3A62_02255, partial [Thermodesulfovibrionales bacterium]|nr:hypothetical protein [Thermodesulfovibrionales bacterium]